MDFDEASFTFELKDKKLFKQQCFINGEWIDSETVKLLKFITLLIYQL